MDQNNNTQPQDYEVQLHELALRLASYPGYRQMREPQLLVGQLPSTFPAEIPLLEDCRVVGSLVRSEESLEIVLDTTQSKEQVFAFYRERLLAAGWHTYDTLMGFHEPPAQQRGFAQTPATGQSTRAIYCQGIGGPSFILAAAGINGRTDVRLTLDRSNTSPCARASRLRWEQTMRVGAIFDLIPLLQAPTGARQKSWGSGHSAEYAYTSALLQTDVELAQLSVHYGRQLEQAGWMRTGEGLSGPLVWQTWTFQDEDQQPWNGQFFILKAQGKERHHYLYMQVDWANASE